MDLDYTSKEAMNTLCTNLSFSGDSLKKIMITSCRPHEGKSYISMNLMRAMASIGKSVILVDADLRKSMLAGRYGIQTNDKLLGLSHYLAGMCPAEDIVYQTNIENAHMILAGQEVVNSLPLLNTPRLPGLLNGLADYYDVVIIDTSPVGVLIDSAQIAKSCDGVLFVVTDNEINRRELKEARLQIEKTGCPILGAVLNKTEFNSRSSRKYYQKSYYSYQQAYYGDDSKSVQPMRTPKKTKKAKQMDQSVTDAADEMDQDKKPTNQGIAE